MHEEAGVSCFNIPSPQIIDDLANGVRAPARSPVIFYNALEERIFKRGQVIFTDWFCQVIALSGKMNFAKSNVIIGSYQSGWADASAVGDRRRLRGLASPREEDGIHQKENDAAHHKTGEPQV